MNTTTKTTARPGNTIPTTVDLQQIPARALSVGQRISVKLFNYSGALSGYGSHFTLGSVAAYAASYGDDVEARVALSKERGEDLHYAMAEGVMLTAHPQERVTRVELELGTIIELDGEKFQILQAPNQNLKLVPLSTI